MTRDIREQVALGNLFEAERMCRERLAQAPDDAMAQFFLAYVLWRTSRAGAALESARRALALAPADPGLLNDLGNLLRELGANESALDALERSLQQRPEHPGARYNKALVLARLGREGEALQLADGFDPAAALYSRARFLAGKLRQDLGDMGGAETAFRECIGADRDMYKAWLALVHTRRFTVGEAIFPDLDERLAGRLEPEARSHYLFALAKVLDDTAQHGDAAERLLEANALVQDRYDAETIETRIASLREQFPDPIEMPAPAGGSPVPVFIVGLPRSGTTLLESLLHRHPGIETLGESHTLPGLVPDFRELPDREALRALGSRYLEAVPESARQARRVLDKMPSNFWRLGHIALMLPGAKIIHCRRDPRDVAVSNFFSLYADGNSFAYELGNLAHYSACHDAIMAHWRRLLGARIRAVEYADLAREPGPVLRETTAFLGLDWDDAWLDGPAPQRRIRTASLWQARQPVYTTSIGRYRNYPRLAEAFAEHYRRFSKQVT